jgi:hypothetical protein
MSLENEVRKSRRWSSPRRGVGTLFLSASFAMLATGCAGSMAEFRPPASIDVGPPNAGAAYYMLDAGEHHVGDAKVWTRGIKKEGRQDEAPAIRLGLRIRDDGADPIRVDLDASELEIQTTDGKLFFQKASNVSGNASIDPHSTGRLYWAFDLPSNIRSEDVTAFEFNWTIESGDLRMSRSTPFFRKRVREDSRYFYVDPGFRFGYGWGWHHLPPYWWW